MRYVIRQALEGDLVGLIDLYRTVAASPGGLARREDEITEAFVHKILHETSGAGLFLVMEESARGSIIGAIHAAHGKTESLKHVMGHLTILVHPGFQSQGLGRRLFSEFLSIVKAEFPFVVRVELRARASNLKALKLYEDLGFVQEGRFQSRIKTHDGQFEDGIPMAWLHPEWKKLQCAGALVPAGSALPCGPS